MVELYKAKEVSQGEWESYWRQCPQANMLQSWQYGTAKKEAECWEPVRLLIIDGSGKSIALAQVLTKTVPFLGGIARLNRGPLLIEELPDVQSINITLNALCTILREARQRLWWAVFAAPELPNTEAVHQRLRALGFRHRPHPAWASGRITLSADEDAILMHFNGKWRNSMRKGLRLGVKVTDHDGTGSEMYLLTQHYKELQQSKDFDGIPEKMIKSLAHQQGDKWQFNLFLAHDTNALSGDEPIGTLVSVRHGDSTTYLIGTSNDKGRTMQANSVLLWHAIQHAKHAGCDWFDIGGLSDATPRGIAEFKKGLNAVPYSLVGEWRFSFIDAIFSYLTRR